MQPLPPLDEHLVTTLGQVVEAEAMLAAARASAPRAFRSIRHHMGFTNAQMARHIGVSSTYLTAVEKGRGRIGLRIMKLMAAAYQAHLTKTATA